jgi:hypothetical protein
MRRRKAQDSPFQTCLRCSLRLNVLYCPFRVLTPLSQRRFLALAPRVLAEVLDYAAFVA